MELINLTPHPVIILEQEYGTEVANLMPASWYQQDLPVARIEIDRKQIGKIKRVNGDGGLSEIPILSSRFAGKHNVPEPRKGTFYIVSSVVAQALEDRQDVLFPDQIVRDDNGKIIGCQALSTFAESVDVEP